MVSMALRYGEEIHLEREWRSEIALARDHDARQTRWNLLAIEFLSRPVGFIRGISYLDLQRYY